MGSLNNIQEYFLKFAVLILKRYNLIFLGEQLFNLKPKVKMTNHCFSSLNQPSEFAVLTSCPICYKLQWKKA